MTSERAAAPQAGTAGKTGPLPFDTSIVNQARMYDYVLGGKDNFAVDRAAAEALLAIWPEMAYGMRANRAFLGRVVRYLAAEAGIRQFLDIGTGIPTEGNTHEVAQAIAPESRVVYVDYDPVVLAHARVLLTSNETGATDYIHADLRDTDKILAQAADLLDFGQPVAVTLLSILQAVPDSDDPHAIVAKIMDTVPAGSYLAISHTGSDLIPQETKDALADLAKRIPAQQRLSARDREQVARFFQGMDLVEPGLVPVEKWRPAAANAVTQNSATWGAVARKRPAPE